MVLMHFPGWDDMTAAETLKTKILSIKRSEVQLKKGEFLDAELIGMQVYEDFIHRYVGTVEEVLTYPAHKLYKVRGPEKCYLIPAVQDIFIVDIDAEKRDTERLRMKAQLDPLTGLYNASSARKRIEASLQQPPSVGMHVLAVIDVNHFKQINDTCGHLTGDHALIETARRLGSMLNEGDIAGRIGGDEFAVIMVDVNQELSYTIREKITVINNQLYCPTDDLPAISLSAGVAFTDRANPGESIFKDADKALYLVKENSRRGCAIY